MLKYQTLPIDETVAPFNCVGIDVEIAAEWSGFDTGIPLAVVGALNLKSKSKPCPDAK